MRVYLVNYKPSWAPPHRIEFACYHQSRRVWVTWGWVMTTEQVWLIWCNAPWWFFTDETWMPENNVQHFAISVRNQHGLNWTFYWLQNDCLCYFASKLVSLKLVWSSNLNKTLSQWKQYLAGTQHCWKLFCWKSGHFAKKFRWSAIGLLTDCINIPRIVLHQHYQSYLPLELI